MEGRLCNAVSSPPLASEQIGPPVVGYVIQHRADPVENGAGVEPASKVAPMLYAVSYVAALVAMAIIDAVWLTSMANVLYRPTLRDIMLPAINYAPAIVFYLLYPIGLLVFAVEPAFRSGSVGTALAYGALFGFMAYGAYDLTNHATLRNWTLTLTVVDMAWGTILSGLVSAAAFYAGKTAVGLPS